MLPREKAIEFGISSLSNEELLALIIKTGSKENNVFEVVDKLLFASNGFNNLLCLNYEELIQIKGINKAKALEILAILEIAKRLNTIETIKEDEISSPNKLVEWLRLNIGFKENEEFLVVFINKAGKIIKSEVLFKGSKDTSVVAIDEILRKAILLKASGIVVCHNHPSGRVEPSMQDKVITSNLKNACNMMNIRLLDHIVVSKSSYYSFKQAGLI